MKILQEVSQKRELARVTEQVAEALAKEDFDAYNQIAADCLLDVAARVSQKYIQANLLFVPPFEQGAFLYLGFSETLDAAKIGVSRDPAKRADQINGSMRSLGMPKDFTMIFCDYMPERIAYDLEARTKRDLQGIHKFGEWYGGEGPEVFDWHFEMSQLSLGLWEEKLSQYSAADCLKQADHFIAMFSKLPYAIGEARFKAALKWAQFSPESYEIRPRPLLAVPA